MRFDVRPILAGLALAACSADATQPTGCVTESIVGGSPGPTLVRLDGERLRAIVAILIPSSTSSDPPDVCSGVVVSPGAVLTAGHCFRERTLGADGRVGGSATVVFGSPYDSASMEVTLGAIWRHPELDVAVLGASSPVEAYRLASAETDGAFIPPHFIELEESWVGAAVELAGYGVSESAAAGTLGFAVEEVAGLESDHIVVAGEGRSGACAGDSGGPLLGTSSDGAISVLGVLDDGEASCLGEDRYTRLDRLAGWPPLARLVDHSRRACD